MPIYLQRHLDLLSHDEQWEFAEAIYDKAVQAAQIGDIQLAECLLEQLAKDLPAHAQARLVIGLAYIKMKNYDQALANLKRAAHLIPNEFRIWELMGWVDFKSERLPHAMIDLEHALSINPQATISLFLLGMVKYELGHDPDDIECLFRRAVESDPNNKLAWECLLGYLKERGKTEESDPAHAHYIILDSRN